MKKKITINHKEYEMQKMCWWMALMWQSYMILH